MRYQEGMPYLTFWILNCLDLRFLRIYIKMMLTLVRCLDFVRMELLKSFISMKATYFEKESSASLKDPSKKFYSLRRIVAD